MRRTLLLLGAAASAAAFSASPMSLRGSAPARAVSRSGATAVKMDVDTSLIIATLPGLAALGLSLQSAQGLYLSQPVALLLPLSRMSVLRLSLSGFLWRNFTRLLYFSLALSGALLKSLSHALPLSPSPSSSPSFSSSSLRLQTIAIVHSPTPATHSQATWWEALRPSLLRLLP